MFGLPSPELDAIICRKNCKEQLQDIPSEELEELVKHILEKNKRERVDFSYLAFANPYDDLFIASGACDVLRERRGQNYINKITGLRKPKSIKEK